MPCSNPGPIQVLVHNAGIHDDVPMAAMTEAQWRGVMAVSLDGFFHVARAAAAADDGHAQRADRRDVLRFSHHGQSRAGELRRRQGRADRRRARALAGMCAPAA
jgi:NAD(P)-dependent dehydrogenase (short-subunit alcohol dehydrogenase family)